MTVDRDQRECSQQAARRGNNVQNPLDVQNPLELSERTDVWWILKYQPVHGVPLTSADSAVRIYCAVSVSQNLKFFIERVFECPDFEFELDFDRQTPHSNSGQNPDSAVRRRLAFPLFSKIISPLERPVRNVPVDLWPSSFKKNCKKCIPGNIIPCCIWKTRMRLDQKWK